MQKEYWNLAEIENRTQQLIADIAILYLYFEARDSYITKTLIHIDYQNVYAEGCYYTDNGSVEIHEESTLYMDSPSP